MNIDNVKARLKPKQRAKAAAAIREMLDKRRYLGWTGRNHTRLTGDYMCDALAMHDEEGAALAREAIEAQLGESHTLGVHLHLSPRAWAKHEGHRRTALRWWREFIKALEDRA